MNTSLLETLCRIPSTAGDESRMRDFIINFLSKNGKHFKSSPKVYAGPGFQDLVIAVFGTPRTAVFAHMDGVGFTAAHDGKLFKIGNPKAETGAVLVGSDGAGEIKCTLEVKKAKKRSEGDRFAYVFDRKIEPGTTLTYDPEFKETKNYVKSAYLDNRLGVWNALELAGDLVDGALAFTTYEEHGGGSAQFAGRFLQENFGVQQALISDVTLVSDHIKHKKGVAISMRDRGIPRRSFVERIIAIAKKHGISHQLEVEKAGGSDGNALQSSSFLWDWCFIGPPESNYHRPGEKVHKDDITAMQKLYRVLMEEL
jgi:putative aminopeptidase FrvX